MWLHCSGARFKKFRIGKANTSCLLDILSQTTDASKLPDGFLVAKFDQHDKTHSISCKYTYFSFYISTLYIFSLKCSFYSYSILFHLSNQGCSKNHKADLTTDGELSICLWTDFYQSHCVTIENCSHDILWVFLSGKCWRWI